MNGVAYIGCMEVEQIYFVGVQSLKTVQQTTLESFLLVCVLVRTHAARIELGVHDEAAFLPLQLSEQSFGRSIDTCGVDLIVTVLLENINDGCNVFDSMDASSFGTWLCFSVLIRGIYPKSSS